MAEDTKNVKFHEEVQKMEYEPQDATELKLIHWSRALGVFLLVALYFLSDFIAPGAQVSALSIHISGVSIKNRLSMPSDSASCMAFMVSSRQSG